MTLASRALRRSRGFNLTTKVVHAIEECAVNGCGAEGLHRCNIMGVGRVFGRQQLLRAAVAACVVWCFFGHAAGLCVVAWHAVQTCGA